MTQPYVPPAFEASSFNCPFCNAYAKQDWGKGHWYLGGYSAIEGLSLCQCSYCCQFSVWWAGKMLYPSSSTAPLPNQDLPEAVRVNFEEARQIAAASPRAAAALLRLAVQQLCRHLGGEGRDLNQDVAALAAKGLPEKLRQALELVRVTGRDAVPPGRLDQQDDAALVSTLFSLLNLLAELMISQPQAVDLFYAEAGLENDENAPVEEESTPRI